MMQEGQAALEPGEYQSRSRGGRLLEPVICLGRFRGLDVASVSERAKRDGARRRADLGVHAGSSTCRCSSISPHPATSTVHPVCQGSGFGGTRVRTPCGGLMASTPRRRPHRRDWAPSFQMGWKVCRRSPRRGQDRAVHRGSAAAMRRIRKQRLSRLIEVLHPPSSWVAHNTLGAHSPSGRSEAWDTERSARRPSPDTVLLSRTITTTLRPGPRSTAVPGLACQAASRDERPLYGLVEQHGPPFVGAEGSNHLLDDPGQSPAGASGTFVRHGCCICATFVISAGPAGTPKR